MIGSGAFSELRPAHFTLNGGKMNQLKYDGKRENVRQLFSGLDYWIVKQAIRTLPVLERIAIELRFWNRYSVLEIAERNC